MARLQLKSLLLIVAITVAAGLRNAGSTMLRSRHAAIFLASMVAICAYGAPRDWWRHPDLLVILGFMSAIGLVLFLVAPSTLGR